MSDELAAVAGRSVDEWNATSLVHNPKNEVTASVARVRWPEGSAVVKVLQPPQGQVNEWAASTEPGHWNLWNREHLAYTEGLIDRWDALGVGAPELLASFARPDGSIALWLEDLTDQLPGPVWALADFGDFARALGRVQGTLASEQPAFDWLSRAFLRRYCESKPVGDSLLAGDETFRIRLADGVSLGDVVDAEIRAATTALRADRGWYFDLMERLPRTMCHLDVWPNNLFRRRGDGFALVDWTFVGDGALGEDIGNLIPDSVFDLFVPASEMGALTDTVLDGYLAGLAEVGWRGDEGLVRLGMYASAVKYEWLLPILVQRATLPAHAYGGGAELDPVRQWRERVAGLETLVDWAAQAKRLAIDAGI